MYCSKNDLIKDLSVRLKAMPFEVLEAKAIVTILSFMVNPVVSISMVSLGHSKSSYRRSGAS